MTETQDDITVRPALPEDRQAVLELMPRLAAFDVPESRDPKDLWTSDAELFERWCEGEVENFHAMVAVVSSGSIVGLAIATLRPEMLSKAPSAHLEAIAVAEGMAGRGIGQRLLAAVEDRAREHGAQSMTLHVFASNERARRFYEKSGYDGELLRYIKPLNG